jgi:SIR2-like domain
VTAAVLRDAVRDRDATLVVGAGISLPYGIPTWAELTRRVWVASFPDRPSPWVGEDGPVPRQFFPIVFELAKERLGERRFGDVLRTCLYGEARTPSDEAATTLDVLARLLAGQVGAAGRRIVRVVTFNADNLLELAVARVWRAAGRPGRDAVGSSPVRLIARPSQQPAAFVRGPIPVYHLHGFVPSTAGAPYSRNYEHTLVFTDSQYWATTNSLLSLPNTIMGAALHDSTCVFVGLSMTDANILRWLALRSIEFATELEQRTARGRADLRRGVLREVQSNLRRHFWIRPAADDPSGLLSEFLAARGVSSVEIDDWSGRQLGELLEGCFDGRRE